RDQFLEYFPGSVITVALSNDEDKVILAEPSVTDAVIAALECLMEAKMVPIPPDLQVNLQKADQYLGTLILTSLRFWTEFKSLRQEHLLQNYGQLLALAIDKDCLSLMQYLFRRIPAELTHKLDQGILEVITTQEQTHTTPFVKLLLQRGCESSLPLCLNCIRTGLAGPFKLLWEAIRDSAHIVDLLLTAIQ